MSSRTVRAVNSPPTAEDQAHIDEQERPAGLSLAGTLKSYALLTAAAVLLLSLIEWVDLNIQLTPVFASLSDRAAFTAYFSLNILSGLLIGLAVGAFIYAAAFLKRAIERILARGGKARLAHKMIAGLIVCAISAAALNQQAHIHGYAVALMIEAQKLPHFYDALLPHRRVLSYLIIFGLVEGCAMILTIARATSSMRPLLRRVWLAGLAVTVAAAYYVDSRIEVQLYGYSLHRSMFLLSLAMAMAFIATLALSARSEIFRAGFASNRKKVLALAAAVVLAASAAFTFIHFDRDQNLKTQIFSRTTQAKQHFQLFQWALDFDRDGFSSLLGGGDADDTRREINPGVKEVVGDGIDNNGIGGDLTAEQIQDWRRARISSPANASARKLNVIYIFIDALRADHLGAYGYERNTSPNIDRLAERSSLFENAFSPSANTFESTPKFMQSSYWDAHLEAWTETLARSGYDTMLFPGRRLSMLRRYVKGAEPVEAAVGKGLKETIDVAIDTLGGRPTDRPFCAFIYSVDPHSPYAPHEKFDFGSSITDRYDGEIAYTDFHYGRLFDWLEKSGRMKDTVVVVMADHGESLGERGIYRHSSQLYNDQTHIPMIVHHPDAQPRRIADYVSSVDLGTTILDAVGAQWPADYVGVSLLPLMRGEAFAHPPIFGEESYKPKEFPNLRPEDDPQIEIKKFMVVTQDGYKLIYNQNFCAFEMFNIKDDPREERNLYDREPVKAKQMASELGRFIDIVGASRPWDADERKYFFGSMEEDYE